MRLLVNGVIVLMSCFLIVGISSVHAELQDTGTLPPHEHVPLSTDPIHPDVPLSSSSKGSQLEPTEISSRNRRPFSEKFEKSTDGHVHPVKPEFTQQRAPFNVNSVKPEFTQERAPFNVHSVKPEFAQQHAPFNVHSVMPEFSQQQHAFFNARTPKLSQPEAIDWSGYDSVTVNRPAREIFNTRSLNENVYTPFDTERYGRKNLSTTKESRGKHFPFKYVWNLEHRDEDCELRGNGLMFEDQSFATRDGYYTENLCQWVTRQKRDQLLLKSNLKYGEQLLVTQFKFVSETMKLMDRLVSGEYVTSVIGKLWSRTHMGDIAIENSFPVARTTHIRAILLPYFRPDPSTWDVKSVFTPLQLVVYTADLVWLDGNCYVLGGSMRMLTSLEYTCTEVRSTTIPVLLTFSTFHGTATPYFHGSVTKDGLRFPAAFVPSNLTESRGSDSAVMKELLQRSAHGLAVSGPLASAQAPVECLQVSQSTRIDIQITSKKQISFASSVQRFSAFVTPPVIRDFIDRVSILSRNEYAQFSIFDKEWKQNESITDFLENSGVTLCPNVYQSIPLINLFISSTGL